MTFFFLTFVYHSLYLRRSRSRETTYFFYENAMASTQNSFVIEAPSNAFVAELISSTKKLTQNNFFWSYQKAVYYPLRTFDNNHSGFKLDSIIS